MATRLLLCSPPSRSPRALSRAFCAIMYPSMFLVQLCPHTMLCGLEKQQKLSVCPSHCLYVSSSPAGSLPVPLFPSALACPSSLIGSIISPCFRSLRGCQEKPYVLVWPILCPTLQHDSCPLSSAELVTAIFQPLNTPHLAAAPLFSQHYLLPSPHPPSQLLLFPSQMENLQGALIPHTRLGHPIMNP